MKYLLLHVEAKRKVFRFGIAHNGIQILAVLLMFLLAS